MIDYEEIIRNLKEDKVIELMHQLGADRYEDSPKALIFPTICHNESSDDASKKLYYYKDNHFFYCYSECGGQSIFNFLKNYYETRGIEYNWYNDIYDVVLKCSASPIVEGFVPGYRESLIDRYKKQKKIVELTKYDNGVLQVFTKTYPPEWLNDSITKLAMDKFNILYSISQNKIIIPHYDVNGKLVGVRGRALNQWEIENVGKYLPVQIEGKWYSHSLSMNLYGLNFTKDAIKKTGICYIFEAEKSVLQVEGFSIPNCSVAVCGSNINKFQIALLMKECMPKEIVICFDKEELLGEEEYFNKLYNIGEKYKNYCNFSFIYDRENLLNMKDSPSDRGEQVFRKLLEKRVQVR